MRRIAIVIPILLAAADAAAIPGPEVTKMTCANVQGAINSTGAMFLHYRSKRTGTTIYNRYVRDRQSCSADQNTAPASVPTSDKDSCPVKICVDNAGQR